MDGDLSQDSGAAIRPCRFRPEQNVIPQPPLTGPTLLGPCLVILRHSRYQGPSAAAACAVAVRFLAGGCSLVEWSLAVSLIAQWLVLVSSNRQALHAIFGSLSLIRLDPYWQTLAGRHALALVSS